MRGSAETLVRKVIAEAVTQIGLRPLIAAAGLPQTDASGLSRWLKRERGFDASKLLSIAEAAGVAFSRRDGESRP